MMSTTAKTEAERDARRYRWLKMESSIGDQQRIMRTPWTEWDAAIDAAIESGAGRDPDGGSSEL